MMHPVPTDVFINIIRELSMLHRPSLLSLLFVSQQTNVLATPFVYQEIVIDRSGLSPFPWIQDRLASLLRATTQPKLKFASYTSKFIFHLNHRMPSSFYYILPNVMDIISTLPSLRILALHFPVLLDPSALKSLHPSPQLTHLSLPYVAGTQELCEVLESQPTLEFLSLPNVHHHLSLSSGSLPRLRAIWCDVRYGMHYALGRSAEHLYLSQDLYSLGEPIHIHNPQVACQGIRSLHILTHLFGTVLPQLAPYLVDLEYLNVIVQGSPTTADFQSFHSPNLRYLSLNSTYDMTVAQQFTSELFSMFAHLAVVDLSLDTWTLPPWRAAGHIGEYRGRFTRQSVIPTKIETSTADYDMYDPTWKPWDTWWLDAEDIVHALPRNALP